MMSQIISRCGLICSECPAYIATQNNDDQARAKVAEKWSKEFGGSFQASDINCDGCVSNGARVFGYCGQCEIRSCGIGRGLANCGECGEYGCEKITKFFGQAPQVKAVLDGIAEKRK